MLKNNHTDFILSPISNLLREVVTASSGIGSGIETYPLCDYIMQSVFLKMTGFQEQKMKCITWEIATNDYEYRRVLLANEDKLGECSSYNSKNKIYQRLIDQLSNHKLNFEVTNEIDKKQILIDTVKDIDDIFKNSNLAIWAQKSFIEFRNIKTIIKTQQFANDKNLFENVLQNKYKILYNQRNKYAHNTSSYQQNLPSLKTLVDDNYKHNNYFIWFSLLILIDKIFIKLYEKYLEVIG